MSSPLFCKPLPGMPDHEILVAGWSPDIRGTIAFRSLRLSHDLDLVHDWVNQPYARKYWQMEGERDQLHDTYQVLQDNPLAHSYIGLFNGKRVCQIDCYQVAADELKNHVDHPPGAAGFHILMCPPRLSQKGLAVAMIKFFVRFYFSFGAAETLYGEPDSANTAANLAAKRAGFIFQKQIQLSYKTANLYSITRDQFYKSFSYDK